MIGGGTFKGLGSLLTGEDNFDKLVAMAQDGDHAAVDMLVGDIYGKGHGVAGLDENILASSFANMTAASASANNSI